jgi:hypothetical protein
VAQFAEREKTNDLGIQQLVDFFNSRVPSTKTIKRQKVDTNTAKVASPDMTFLNVNLNNLKQSQAVSSALDMGPVCMTRLISFVVRAEAGSQSKQRHGQQGRI